MKRINDKIRVHIREAVQNAEKGTTGEIVCVIAPASARYVLFPLLWALLVALFLPLLNHLPPVPGFFMPLIGFTQQVIFFGVAGVVLCLPPLRWRVTPARVRRGHCHRAARESFFARKLHYTADRAGILIYVSLEEHFIDLIADKGINDRVAAGTWDMIVAAFAKALRAGRAEEGFVSAIQACRRELEQHFPAAGGDHNELPDMLVELPEAAFIG